ncbi:MAG: hypothetical protein ACOY4T_07095 [Pseudomonadota bacterium]|jgi:hypothetical protein
MQYDWILDVLADLKTFAKSNGLAALAERLDDTSLLAAAEIAQRAGEPAGEARKYADQAGPLFFPTPTGKNA